MPIPNRKSGEQKDDFIGRCVAQLKTEYPTKQAAAICYQQLKQFKGREIPLDNIYKGLKK